MKIAVFVWGSSRGGGIQERRIDLAYAWQEQGVRAIFFSATDSSQSVFLEHNFTFHSLFGVKRKLNLSFFSRFKAFLERFSNEKCDVILAAGARSALLSLIVRYFSGSTVPVAVSFHNSFSDKKDGLRGFLINVVNNIFLQIISRKVSAFICVSEGVAAELCAKLPEVSGRTSVIYNALRRDSSMEPQSLPFMHPRSFILGVGRLENQKGFDLLIEAFSSLKNYDLDLLIVGEGSCRRKLEELAKERGIEERLFLLGYRPDVIPIMKAAEAFVLSSRSEGFGTVLVEALFAQTRVISFDCAHGPSEILDNGMYGILVPPGDVFGLAKGISVALSKPKIPNKRWNDFDINYVSNKYLCVLRVLDS